MANPYGHHFKNQGTVQYHTLILKLLYNLVYTLSYQSGAVQNPGHEARPEYMLTHSDQLKTQGYPGSVYRSESGVRVWGQQFRYKIYYT